MKFLLFLFLIGCQYPRVTTSYVDEYVLRFAKLDCEDHGGMDYLVSKTVITAKYSDGAEGVPDYPCSRIYKFHCYDGYSSEYDDGIQYCGAEQVKIKELINDSNN